MIRTALIPVLLFFTCLINLQGRDKGLKPNETQVVLRYLMGATNELIPLNSKCNGLYGQVGKARIKDMLSMHLSYFEEGDNKIVGNIVESNKYKNCTLIITRKNGEDVSYVQIRFSVKNEKLMLDSLDCFMTP